MAGTSEQSERSSFTNSGTKNGSGRYTNIADVQTFRRSFLAMALCLLLGVQVSAQPTSTSLRNIIQQRCPNASACTITLSRDMVLDMAGPLQLTNNLTIVGASNTSMALLSQSSPINITEGAALTLLNFSLSYHLGSLPSAGLQTTGSLSLSGINLASGAKLNLLMVSVTPNCQSWIDLNQVICGQGRVLGDVVVSNDMAVWHRLGDTYDAMSWRNVIFNEPQQCDFTRTDGIPSCVTRSFTGDSDILTVLHEATLQLQALQSNGNDQSSNPGKNSNGSSSSSMLPRIRILLQSDVSLLVNTSAMQQQAVSVPYNVTISGYSRAAELDINLVESALVITGAGTVTLQDLTLVNLPSSPSQYPMGLLTCLPWFVDFNRDSKAIVQLRLKDAIMTVPDDQFAYLKLWIFGPGPLSQDTRPSQSSGDVPPARSFILDSWMLSSVAQPPGARDSIPLHLDQVSGSNVSSWPGSWIWQNVDVYGSSLQIKSIRKINDTGLGIASTPLTLPQEKQNNQPVYIAMITPVGPVLTTTTLSIASPSPGNLPGYSATHLLLNQDAVMMVPAPVSRAELHVDGILAGDPMQASRFVLDLSQVATDPQGVISLVQMGSGRGTRLHLRKLVLYGALPATPPNLSLSGQAARALLQGGPQGDPLQPPTAPPSGPFPPAPSDGAPGEGIGQLMQNWTMMLWLFDVNRSAECSPPSSPNCSSLQLRDVTFVIPPVELQVLRSLLAGASPSSLGISRQVADLLQQQLRQSQVNVNASGSLDQDIHNLPDGPVPASDAALMPGNLFFTQLSWFGMNGTNVNLTALTPPQITPPDVEALSKARVSSLVQRSTPRPPQPSQPPSPLDVGPIANQGPDPRPAWRDVPPLPPRPSLPPMPPVVEELWVASSGSLSGWRLALVIIGSVIAAGAAACLVTILVLRYRRSRMDVKPDNYKCPSPAMLNLAAVDYGRESDSLPAALASPGKTQAQAPIVSNQGKASAPSSVMGDNSSGVPLTSLINTSVEVGASRRQNTGTLLEEIFRDADVTSVHSVASTVAGSPRVGSEAAAAAAAAAAVALAADPRHKIQQEISMMRQELHGKESPWEVQGQLGKGAFGVVYKGTWRGLEVAIKRVIFQVLAETGDEVNRRTALREAAINATLDHPNIVATYTYDMQPLGDAASANGGVADWQMYIVQEYCDGGSLFDAIQDRRFHLANQAQAPEETSSAGSPAEHRSCARVAGPGGDAMLQHILSVAQDIAAGCAYIHSKNIIHGDLKPDNVLLKLTPGNALDGKLRSGQGPGCVAKVADFGMSMNIRGNNTHISGVKHGTPLYIPPEILRNGKASKSADVYSFGVIMWELYHGTSAWQHMLQVNGGPVKKRTLLTFQPDLYAYDAGTCVLPAYAQLGRSCLDEDPLARPTFEDVLKALEEMSFSLEQRMGREEEGGMREEDVGLLDVMCARAVQGGAGCDAELEIEVHGSSGMASAEQAMGGTKVHASGKGAGAASAPRATSAAVTFCSGRLPVAEHDIEIQVLR